jgi:ribosomal protein S27E
MDTKKNNNEIIDKAKEYRKEYYLKNKNKILDGFKTKIKCEFCNKMINSIYYKSHQQKSICSKYQNSETKRSKDREYVKEYNKKYYNENREKILEKQNTKIKCEFCDREVLTSNYGKHKRTDICKRKQQEKINRLKRLNLANE